MTPPKVQFVSEESLRFGEFGVTARLTGGGGPRAKDAPNDTSGQTRIFQKEDSEGQRKSQQEAGGTAAISAQEARQQGLARERVELVVNGETYKLEGRGPWVVGRADSNDVVVKDPNISRKHAKLVRSENGYLVEDLGSTNGTLLGGAPIDRERIDDGDELTFGQVTAQFIRRSDARGGTPRGGAASGHSGGR
jgi:pSer/pThr/pTyr-binding forkhead associated (FHA) protein